MHKLSLFITAASLMMPPLAYSQERPSGGTSVYRLEFNIHDGADSAAKAGRRYSQTIEMNGKGVFRVGSKVPYATGAMQAGASAGASAVATQYNYADIGVNIDSRLREAGEKILVLADLDLSTIAQRDKTSAGTPLTPTISSLRVTVSAALTPGKPALVASIDDPVTMRKFDVEATITKVD